MELSVAILQVNSAAFILFLCRYMKPRLKYGCKNCKVANILLHAKLEISSTTYILFYSDPFIYCRPSVCKLVCGVVSSCSRYSEYDADDAIKHGERRCGTIG